MKNDLKKLEQMINNKCDYKVILKQSEEIDKYILLKIRETR